MNSTEHTPIMIYLINNLEYGTAADFVDLQEIKEKYSGEASSCPEGTDTEHKGLVVVPLGPGSSASSVFDSSGKHSSPMSSISEDRFANQSSKHLLSGRMHRWVAGIVIQCG
uniref:Uncharacterized protein n=1 Tax=Magallana gigas TaxID=29159 RepID=K1PFV3_MAGGI